MTPRSRAIGQLRHFCQKWGGDLLVLTRQAFNARAGFDSVEEDPNNLIAADGFRGFWHAPFADWHGFDYEQGVIYAAEGFADPGVIVHEMGHLFVDRFIDHSDEFDWFGWEIALARAAGCYRAWSRQNATYSVSVDPDRPVEDWGTLRSRQKQRIAAERIGHAAARGYLGPRNHPLATITRPLTRSRRDLTRRYVARVEKLHAEEIDRRRLAAEHELRVRAAWPYQPVAAR